MVKALVITPTTGAPELEDAIASVKKQTMKCDHLVIVDGQEFSREAGFAIARADQEKTVIKTVLPFNTGANGFYGHRVMAGFSHLVNHDYILFLDQDNWYDPSHVESLVDEITKYKFDWAYSLRKVYNKDKKYVCEDDCESLGRWPVWVNDEAHLIDSSSYCFSLSFLRSVGHLWDFGWGADRRFYTIVKDQIKHNNYGCTGLSTLNYRLGGNEGSVTGDFFIDGNKKMEEKYAGKYPWRQQLK